MPIIIPINEVQQNTPEWHGLRLGIPTSSAFSRVLTMGGERSKSWEGYAIELALERLSGTANTFESWQMRLGHEQEPEGRWLYEQMNQVTVQEVAFVYRDESRLVGCSTDGLVGANGVWECKGGEGKTHYERLKTHEVRPETFPNKHFQQLHGELYVCEREWVDLFGFFPGMRPIEVRVYRDEKWIKALDRELPHFLEDIDKAVEFAKAA